MLRPNFFHQKFAANQIILGMPGISRFFPLSCESYIPVSTAFPTLKSLWLDPQAVVYSFICIRIVVFIWVLTFSLVSWQTQWSLETQWKKAREQNLQKHGLLELTLRTGKSCKGQECNRVSEMGDGQTAQWILHFVQTALYITQAVFIEAWAIKWS